MVCVTPYLSRCLLGVLVSAVRRLCVPVFLSVQCRLVVNFGSLPLCHMQRKPRVGSYDTLGCHGKELSGHPSDTLD